MKKNAIKNEGSLKIHPNWIPQKIKNGITI